MSNGIATDRRRGIASTKKGIEGEARAKRKVDGGKPSRGEVYKKAGLDAGRVSKAPITRAGEG